MKFRCETCCCLLEIKEDEKEITCPTCGSVYNHGTAKDSHLKYLMRHEISEDLALFLRMLNYDVMNIDDKEYITWTVGYVSYMRPDIAKKIVEEVEKANKDTFCRCDVRIRAFQEIKGNEPLIKKRKDRKFSRSEP